MSMQTTILVIAYLIPGLVVWCFAYRAHYVHDRRTYPDTKFSSSDRGWGVFIGTFCGALWPIVVTLFTLYRIIKPVMAALERPVK